jgi:hypothetical protein
MSAPSPERPATGAQALPEPAAAAKAAPWWRVPATAIPIAISVVALAISGASYWDLHQANRQLSAADRLQNAAAISAAAAAREADAKVVSYDPDPGNPKIVTVQNLGQQPIYSTSLFGLLTISSKAPVTIYYGVWLGQLVPCSTTRVDLQYPQFVPRAAVAAGGGLFISQWIAAQFFAGVTYLPHPMQMIESARWQWRTTGLTFTDGNGLTWILGTRKGRPTLLSPPFLYPSESRNGPPAPASTAPAAGCST